MKVPVHLMAGIGEKAVELEKRDIIYHIQDGGNTETQYCNKDRRDLLCLLQTLKKLQKNIFTDVVRN